VIFLVNNKLKIFGMTTIALLLLVGIVSASQESHALVIKGVDLNNAKKYDDAISNFNKAIDLDPQDSAAWFYKGAVLVQESKIKEADEAIDHALLLNPANSNYNVAKGLVLAMQGKNDEAENYANKGLVLNSNNSVGLGAKGDVAEAKGDKARVIFDYYKAMKLSPGNIASLNELQKLEHT
jgi:protein O-GlcNAc transferase